MGKRLEMVAGESYTSGVVLVDAAAPTDPTTAGTIGIFIGDAVLNHPTCTHLVTVAIGQASAAMKEALTNEGGQAIEDRYNIREPLDPTKQVGQLLAVATEAHVWLGFEGTVLESSSSQFLVGAVEKLMVAYREHIGVGK